MLRFFTFLFVSFLGCSTSLSGQSAARELLGAWTSSFVDTDGQPARLTMIIAEGYMSMTAFTPASGAFIATLGGSWQADWDNFSLNYEWDSSDSSNVGRISVMPYTLTGDLLIFNQDKVWTRVDDNHPGKLAGAWEIVGRYQNGQLQDLSARRDGPRKTMKILSGSRFQWIAFDTSRPQFIATGGGRYTTNADGLYVEKIEYFSKDASKVGRSLSFDFTLLPNGDWKHRGSSTTGKPVHEIWSLR